ncbi:hypothetical protein H072_6323 [Dactylellina haptotyla CBS 200.50]|uniref:F-box domain-containing protein n=1 Tax=Dactylellina haptotyla (strain CBS 200.50) TaxID=1284197 RepID=S8BXB4_DACHA|nr:hypothetical protein H072_6323 [Dactylellina haptotyla CBS 200.50]
MNTLPLEIILQIVRAEELKVWDILQLARCSRRLWRMLETELYRHSLEVVYPLHPPPSYESYEERYFVRKARQREIAQSSFAVHIKTLEFVLSNRPNAQQRALDRDLELAFEPEPRHNRLEETDDDGATIRGILSGCTQLHKLTLRAGKIYRTGQNPEDHCSPIDLFTTLAFAIRTNKDLKELSISGEYFQLTFPAPPEGALEALLELEGRVMANIQKLDIDYEVATTAPRAAILDTIFAVLGQSIRDTKELTIGFSTYTIRLRSYDAARYAKHFPVETASWPFQNLRKLVCNDSSPQQILCVAATRIDTTKIIEIGMPLSFNGLNWISQKVFSNLILSPLAPNCGKLASIRLADETLHLDARDPASVFKSRDS